MGDFIKVAKAADITPGTMKGIVSGENRILVVNVGGKYYAIEDRCSHLGAKLSTGLLMGNIVMCMAHAAQYDVTTGEPLTAIGKGPVRTYEVRVNGEDIEVKI